MKNFMASLALILGLTLAGASQSEPEKTISFDLPPQSLATALNAFAGQANLRVVFSMHDIRGLLAKGIVGNLTPREALSRLLNDSKLHYEFVDEKTVEVRSANGNPDTAASDVINAEPDTAEMQLAQMTPVQKDNRTEQDAKASSRNVEDPAATSEVIVTGTHIRDGEAVGATVVSVGRKEIERRGFSTVQDVVQSLPQNFGGDITEDGIGSGSGNAALNYSYGTAANLRGLGSLSTLTLVNGRRLPSSGVTQTTDLSMIPLSAIERVDVLLDGASALYGSDAVGGAVNLVLRRDYAGADTVLRSGFTSDGGARELRAGQSLGTTWDGGGVLGSYEYYDRDKLLSSQRDSTRGAEREVWILPEQTRHSFYLTGHQRVSEDSSVFLDSYYTKRDVSGFSYDSFLDGIAFISNLKQYGVAGGFDLDLGQSWRAQLTLNYGQSEMQFLSTYPDYVGYDITNDVDNNVRSAELAGDGVLLSTSGGDARLALGAGTRKDIYDVTVDGGEFSGVTAARTVHDRTITYAFAELQMPIVGEQNARRGLRALKASLSGRYEHYSDFGSATDPRIGLQWRPINDLQFKASFGKSFRAPNFNELDLTTRTNIIADNPDGAGFTRVLRPAGGNAALTPERAKSWTFGVDFAPSAIAGLNLGLDYYNIKYQDRILAPSVDFSTLNNPAFAPIVIRRGSIPDADFNARVQQILQSAIVNYGCPNQGNPSSCDINAVQAIVDGRYSNLSETLTRGFDSFVTFDQPVAFGSVHYFMNANYITDFSQRITDTAPLANFVSTGLNPLRLKFTTGATMQVRSWSFGPVINYATDYRSTILPDAVPVASWTTIDLNAAYEHPQGSGGWLDGVRVGLTIQNALDHNPPRYELSRLVQYDQANADPLGRMIAIDIRKTW